MKNIILVGLMGAGKTTVDEDFLKKLVGILLIPIVW